MFTTKHTMFQNFGGFERRLQMPKCDCCKYLCYPEYESSYTACSIFGEEIPEQYERKDGEGCICNSRTLEKFKRLNEEAWMKDKEEFVKWFLSKEEGGSHGLQ